MNDFTSINFEKKMNEFEKKMNQFEKKMNECSLTKKI